MANDYAGVIKGVVAGAIAGFTIWTLMDVNDFISMMMSSWYLDIIAVLNGVVGYVSDIVYILACGMSGFIAILLMFGHASTKSRFRAIIAAGIVAGIISFFVLRNPLPPHYQNSSFIVTLGTWLIQILEFVTVMVLALAGGVLGLAFLKKPEPVAADGRSTSIVAGAIAAVVFAIVYISLNTAAGNTRMAHNALDFIYPTIFGQVEFLLAGLIAGMAAIRLTRQSMSSPFHLVIYTGLAGALAGLLSAWFMVVYDSLFLGLNFFNTFGGDSLPYYLFKILWATLLIMLLTVGSGIIYALLIGELEPGPSGPAAMAAAL